MRAREPSATRHSPSGLVNGVQGIWLGGGSCWIQDRTSLRVGPSTKGWDRTCLASSWESAGCWPTSVSVIGPSRRFLVLHVMIDFPQGRAVASRRPGSRVPCSRGQTPEGGPIQLVGWSAAGCTGLCGHPRSRQPRRHLLTTYLPVVLRTTQRSWAQALVEELQDPVQGGPGGVAWLIHQVDSRHGIGSGGDAPWVAG